MTTQIKAIFFDIGGTLVEKTRFPARDHTAIAQMSALLNLACSPDELLDSINRGQQAYKEWSEATLRELPLDEKWVKYLLPEQDEIHVRKNAQVLQQLWRRSRGSARVKDGVSGVLAQIKQRGYILGTISHSTPAYLDEPELAALFDVHIHTVEYGKRKPHPSLFVDAARKCGVTPAQCAYVGDNPWRDVVGPREAGFASIVLMGNGVSPQLERSNLMQPDFVISNLSELLEIFPVRAEHNGSKQEISDRDVLYDAALSTMWWDKERYSAEEFFGSGRKLGFARFELNHQISPEVMAQVDANRFSIGSLHDPCPAYISLKELENLDIQITSLDETRRMQGVDVVKGTIEKATQLGCRLVVIHPGRIVCDHALDDQLRQLYRAGKKGSPEYEELRLRTIADRTDKAGQHLEQCLESLREIMDFSKGSGVMLGLENRFHYYELPVYNELEAMLNEFTQPWVGWQFDVGHLQVHDQLGLLNMQQWLESFSHRIVGVHLHDVIGIKDHQAAGTGDVDFNRLAGYIPRDCYRALEVDKALTLEQVARSMQHLAECGCVNKV